MPTPSLRRATVVLLLAGLLAASGAFAAARPGPANPCPAQLSWPLSLDLFSRAWNFLTNAWTKEGCRIDPSGHCISSPTPQPPSTNQAKEGCQIDPSGRPHCGS
ncbi:MAG TPA: hypothetical protein VGG03_00700 [Thermoanaerobaculia bacterium]|jgi:hypothetical protein